MHTSDRTGNPGSVQFGVIHGRSRPQLLPREHPVDVQQQREPLARARHPHQVLHAHAAAGGRRLQDCSSRTWLTESARMARVPGTPSISTSTRTMHVHCVAALAGRPKRMARSTTGTARPRRWMTPRTEGGSVGAACARAGAVAGHPRTQKGTEPRITAAPCLSWESLPYGMTVDPPPVLPSPTISGPVTSVSSVSRGRSCTTGAIQGRRGATGGALVFMGTRGGERGDRKATSLLLVDTDGANMGAVRVRVNVPVYAALSGATRRGLWGNARTPASRSPGPAANVVSLLCKPFAEGAPGRGARGGSPEAGRVDGS